MLFFEGCDHCKYPLMTSHTAPSQFRSSVPRIRQIVTGKRNLVMGQMLGGTAIANVENLTEHLWGLLIAHHCQGPREWKPGESLFLQQLTNQLAIAIQQADLHQRLQQANQELERLSNTDALTRVANRRRFDARLEQEWQRARRNRQPLALILCDIDYFKQYNDTYGHPSGDACLVAVAQALNHCLKRATDSLARYGGEEFAAILPNTNAAGAVDLVQAMQRAIAALDIRHHSHRSARRVTLSFGVAVLTPRLQISVQTLIDQADQALYQAKATGRNRYTLVSAPDFPVPENGPKNHD